VERTLSDTSIFEGNEQTSVTSWVYWNKIWLTCDCGEGGINECAYVTVTKGNHSTALDYSNWSYLSPSSLPASNSLTCIFPSCKRQPQLPRYWDDQTATEFLQHLPTSFILVPFSFLCSGLSPSSPVSQTYILKRMFQTLQNVASAPTMEPPEQHILVTSRLFAFPSLHLYRAHDTGQWVPPTCSSSNPTYVWGPGSDATCFRRPPSTQVEPCLSPTNSSDGLSLATQCLALCLFHQILAA
jgi:hypothetical protein